MHTKVKHILLAFFSLSFALVTLFIPTKLENKEEIRKAKLGYPAYFLEQDFFGKYESYYFFPTWEKVDLSRKNPIIGFRLTGLVVDWAIIFLALEIVIYILETIDFAVRKNMCYNQNRKK